MSTPLSNVEKLFKLQNKEKLIRNKCNNIIHNLNKERLKKEQEIKLKFDPTQPMTHKQKPKAIKLFNLTFDAKIEKIELQLTELDHWMKQLLSIHTCMINTDTTKSEISSLQTIFEQGINEINNIDTWISNMDITGKNNTADDDMDSFIYNLVANRKQSISTKESLMDLRFGDIELAFDVNNCDNPALNVHEADDESYGGPNDIILPYDDIDDVEPVFGHKHKRSRSGSLVFEFTKMENEEVCDMKMNMNMMEANDEETKEMEIEMDKEHEIEQEIVDCLMSIGNGNINDDLNVIKSMENNDNNASICFFGEALKKQATTTQTLTDLISISQTKTISVFDEMAIIAQNDDFPFWD